MVFSSSSRKSLDPIIHGVAARQAKTVHLLAHAALQGGLDVAEQQVRRFLVAFRQLRIEVGEHVQIGAQRGAVVHIVRINARPEKCFASLHALQAFQIDAAVGQQFLVFGGEVVAHHGDDFGLGKIAGG